MRTVLIAMLLLLATASGADAAELVLDQGHGLLVPCATLFRLTLTLVPGSALVSGSEAGCLETAHPVSGVVAVSPSGLTLLRLDVARIVWTTEWPAFLTPVIAGYEPVTIIVTLHGLDGEWSDSQGRSGRARLTP